jgi:hypothetical protein
VWGKRSWCDKEQRQFLDKCENAAIGEVHQVGNEAQEKCKWCAFLLAIVVDENEEA